MCSSPPCFLGALWASQDIEHFRRGEFVLSFASLLSLAFQLACQDTQQLVYLQPYCLHSL